MSSYKKGSSDGSLTGFSKTVLASNQSLTFLQQIGWAIEIGTGWPDSELRTLLYSQ
jgi:hypothetical protein